MVVDIKDYPEFNASRRKQADKQMRNRLREILAAPLIGELLGLSTCGAYFRIYRGYYRHQDSKIMVVPSYVPIGSTTTDTGYLTGEWSMNVLSKKGVETLRLTAENLKTAAMATLREGRPRDILALYRLPMLLPEESHRRRLNLHLKDFFKTQHGNEQDEAQKQEESSL